MSELGFKYLLFISLSTKTVNIPFSEAKKVEAKSKKLPGPGWLLENRFLSRGQNVVLICFPHP